MANLLLSIPSSTLSFCIIWKQITDTILSKVVHVVFLQHKDFKKNYSIMVPKNIRILCCHQISSKCSNFQSLTYNHVFLMILFKSTLSFILRDKQGRLIMQGRRSDTLVLLFPSYSNVTNMWCTRNGKGDPQIGDKHIGNIKKK